MSMSKDCCNDYNKLISDESDDGLENNEIEKITKTNIRTPCKD